jgi:hypothetical protein
MDEEIASRKIKKAIDGAIKSIDTAIKKHEDDIVKLKECKEQFNGVKLDPLKASLSMFPTDNYYGSIKEDILSIRASAKKKNVDIFPIFYDLNEIGELFGKTVYVDIVCHMAYGTIDNLRKHEYHGNCFVDLIDNKGHDFFSVSISTTGDHKATFDLVFEKDTDTGKFLVTNIMKSSLYSDNKTEMLEIFGDTDGLNTIQFRYKEIDPLLIKVSRYDDVDFEGLLRKKIYMDIVCQVAYETVNNLRRKEMHDEFIVDEIEEDGTSDQRLMIKRVILRRTSEPYGDPFELTFEKNNCEKFYVLNKISEINRSFKGLISYNTFGDTNGLNTIDLQIKLPVNHTCLYVAMADL